MKGFAPNCRPECTGNSECPNHFSCINQRCQDPCPGSCGENAECKILNHNVVCTCFYGYEGDPTYGCSLIPLTCKSQHILFNNKLINSFAQNLATLNTPIVYSPCDPFPCGQNAECRENNFAGLIKIN